MMKCVLTLVFLFHLCHSDTINTALRTEILRDLSKLEEIKEEINFTSPERAWMRVPSRKMDHNASACVGVFVKGLKHILDNLIVPENSKVVLVTLKANLEKVGNHTENDQKCPLIQAPDPQKIFYPYRLFVRSLRNSSKK